MRRAWWRLWCVAVAAAVAVMLAGLCAADGRMERREASRNCHFPSCCGFTEHTAGCRFVGNRCRCPFISPRPLTFFMRRHHHSVPLTGSFTYYSAYPYSRKDDQERREEDKERKGRESDD
ncbi:uncharacterized protein LOC123510154 [Portunus trituberculatus]|uniref:uncharacterized protein LOC123510154 n=1 Tax=Portunus trituberculatus TaxID=210409 RepID=UPI001E1CC61B|nr:uncharacterized protein LOC123510154 [Portunus trituberculatus]XP_045120955.1 uncharacterized protein LOC123510154 [Portunus trituberculatus]XP_045120956.1 uncharacterized protein LOC123510154 [Portunus trituberculatus]